MRVAVIKQNVDRLIHFQHFIPNNGRSKRVKDAFMDKGRGKRLNDRFNNSLDMLKTKTTKYCQRKCFQ